MDSAAGMKLLVIVANAGFAEEIVETARGEGARGATILNARGEGSHHKSLMGITVDTEKEMILCIVDETTAKRAMETVSEKMGINTPSHCVCFIMPIEKTVGLSAPNP